MTAKRFTVDEGLEDILCWEINDKENVDMTCGECAKLLNELTEENEELKKENKKLRDFEYFVFKSIGELNEKRGE